VKALVDEFIASIRSDYANSCKDVSCGIWSARGNIELRFSFTLKRDGEERTTTFAIPANAATNDLDRRKRISLAMDELRRAIDHSLVVH
jgi:hypothetical protein